MQSTPKRPAKTAKKNTKATKGRATTARSRQRLAKLSKVSISKRKTEPKGKTPYLVKASKKKKKRLDPLPLSKLAKSKEFDDKRRQEAYVKKTARKRLNDLFGVETGADLDAKAFRVHVAKSNCSHQTLAVRIAAKYGWTVTDNFDADIYITGNKFLMDICRNLDPKTRHIDPSNNGTWCAQKPRPSYFGQFKLREGQHWMANRIPGMGVCSEKLLMSHCLNDFARNFPDHGRFFPLSFSINDNGDLKRLRSLCEAKRQGMYILKPSQGSQGDGIQLCDGWDSIIRTHKAMTDQGLQNIIVQEYLTSPLLLDGYKFDLRVYAVVVSLYPLKFLLYKDGLARLCTERYSEPTKKNLGQHCMHLTNYSVNKHNPRFRAAMEDSRDPCTRECIRDRSHKRSIVTAFKQLKCADIDFDGEAIWSRISEACAKTIIAVWPYLWAHTAHVLPTDAAEGKHENSHVYHIVGFDFLLDDQHEPWLLEVNASPSMETDSDMDLRIKQSIWETLFRYQGYIPEISEKERKRNYGLPPDAPRRYEINSKGQPIYVPETLPGPLHMDFSVQSIDTTGHKLSSVFVFAKYDGILWKRFEEHASRGMAGITGTQFVRFLNSLGLLSKSTVVLEHTLNRASADRVFREHLKGEVNKAVKNLGPKKMMMEFPSFCLCMWRVAMIYKPQLPALEAFDWILQLLLHMRSPATYGSRPQTGASVSPSRGARTLSSCTTQIRTAGSPTRGGRARSTDLVGPVRASSLSLTSSHVDSRVFVDSKTKLTRPSTCSGAKTRPTWSAVDKQGAANGSRTAAPRHGVKALKSSLAMHSRSRE